MSKKQALTEFHRGSILAAAERLFAEKGTEKTTMDDIAREAEYSKATLYVYFQSKEEIIGAILFSDMVLLNKKLYNAIESAEDWFQAYDAIYEAIIRFYEENPSTYEAAARQLAVISVDGGEYEGEAKELVRVSGDINRDLMRFLQRGADQGVVDVTRPLAETVLLFWACLSGMVHTAERADSYIQSAFQRDRGGFIRDGALFLRDALTGGKRP